MPACPNCPTRAEDGDRFCAACGTLLVPTTPGGPDVWRAAQLARQSAAVPAWHALDHAVPMCPQCGADVPRPRCADCGAPRGVPVPAPQHRFGALYVRRGRPAVLVGEDTYLMHNGQVRVIARAPKRTAEASAGHSPAHGLLQLAAEAESGSPLPWSPDLLYDHAFAVTGGDAGRQLALDVLAFNRPELLIRCGLGPAETTWLRLVHAARTGDLGGVVTAAAGLPPDRYRHKIAVLAARLPWLPEVTGAAESLGPALLAFSHDERLTWVVGRQLGLVTSHGIGDLALLAERFGVPKKITENHGLLAGVRTGTQQVLKLPNAAELLTLLGAALPHRATFPYGYHIKESDGT